ncbi:flagellar biosynthesis anti-sigma factor FlgM [Limnobacter humi]|uniref:Flagellar biosynthesis anti-sigma factor FlgM n=1 Tax=Limnobacter humi TaxID=1778671 RepID=A0ABT1WJL8_9BURK|nr:flagellar biosynthesis anti-sigma factor FlgM [Limnobacter humi]MCQ8897702.1 flagellar biosynthesis anti-sigma factor FlgM [Limnobacter humi]
MITGNNNVVVYNAPDPKKNDVLSSARPNSIRTAAEKDGQDVVVSITKKTGSMILDNRAPLDADKIERIRRELADGGYKINAALVSERMMADQRALLT